jgi:nicotinamide mononucleotide transporter
MTPLEIAANVFAGAAILLAGRNSLHTWWTGIVGCALFAWLFFENHLYADVTLQAFFIVTGFIGWWQWHHGTVDKPISWAGRSSVLRAIVGGVATTVVYGLLLHHFTDAYAPFADSLVLSFSVVGQLLMMNRRIENWPFWLLVNTVAVPLYFSRGLTLTAAVYAVYWVNALVAWRHWMKLYRQQSVGAG